MKRLLIITFFTFLNLAVDIFAASAPSAMSIPVNAIKVTNTTWQKQLTSTGTLVAEQGITVKAEVPGRITQIFFTSGQYVNANAPLIQLFPDIIVAKLKAAQAAEQLSKTTFERYQTLYKTRAVSQEQVDTAAATYNEDAANVAQMQAALSQTLIKAPFSGYLGIRQISTGDYINAGQAIVNLQDTDPMFVDFSLPEVYSKQVKVGMKVDVSSNAYGNEKFSGAVSAIESLIDPNTRTLTIRASVPNPKNFLIPGSFVLVNLYIGQQQQVISIPQTAIVYDETGNYVYKINKGKAEKTPVILGQRNENNVYVLKGLQVGDQVITAGQQKLFDGAPVSVVPN